MKVENLLRYIYMIKHDKLVLLHSNYGSCYSIGEKFG